MQIGIYGGTFNPPHKGHIRAAPLAAERLGLDKLFVVPAGLPPHKELPEGSPTDEQRFEMTFLAFEEQSRAIVTKLELNRGGTSYTADTVSEIKKTCVGAKLFLLVGSDMFITLGDWKEAEGFLGDVTVVVFKRGGDSDAEISPYAIRLKEEFGAETVIMEDAALPLASSDLREALENRGGLELLPEPVYAYIVKNRLYGVRVNYDWLRARAYDMLTDKRKPHVQGCEGEAVRLALRWGEDTDSARVAGILHDITKKQSLDNQLQLCDKYGIVPSELERESEKLLHAKTGALFAYYEFGVSEKVRDAIYWHTTAKADMTLLEKIIYIADYIEPTRELDGVEELRRLAYDDIDAAVVLGVRMSLEDVEARGLEPHKDSVEAIRFLEGNNK
jgi:nicotinate-nucleotide adenylyltransferase